MVSGIGRILLRGSFDVRREPSRRTLGGTRRDAETGLRVASAILRAMELRHLRYFVAVAEELHFRRAAERLHISQPPLSQQIRQLEAELGVQLLERSRRRVELTAAGAAFHLRAREILDAVDDAARLARRVQRGEVGRLSIGFVGSAMYSVLPDVLRAFRAQRSEVELR